MPSRYVVEVDGEQDVVESESPRLVADEFDTTKFGQVQGLEARDAESEAFSALLICERVASR